MRVRRPHTQGWLVESLASAHERSRPSALLELDLVETEDVDRSVDVAVPEPSRTHQVVASLHTPALFGLGRVGRVGKSHDSKLFVAGRAKLASAELVH